MIQHRVVLRSDPAPIVRAFDELLPALAKRSQLSAELVAGLIGLLEARDELVSLDLSPGPAGTGELTVRLNPSDGFRMLLAAVTAGEIDLAVIEHAFGHDIRSRVEAQPK